MRIFYLQDDFPPESKGGAGAAVSDLAIWMMNAGHEVHVVTTTPDRSSQEMSIQGGLTVHRIFSAYHERWRAYLSLWNPWTAGKVRRLIAQARPDVVHAHNIHYHLSYQCLPVAKASGAKVFLTAHDVMLLHYGKLVEHLNPHPKGCPKTFDIASPHGNRFADSEDVSTRLETRSSIDV